MAVIVAAAFGAIMSGAGPAEPSRDDFSLLSLAMLVLCPVVLALLWMGDVIRPGSPSRHRGRDVSGSPWIIWWAGALVVIFGLGVGGALGAILMGLGREPESGTRSIAAQLIGSAIAAAVGVWVLSLLGGSPRAGLSLVPRKRDVVKGLLAFALVLPIVTAVSYAAAIGFQMATGREPPMLAHQALEEMVANPRSLRTAMMIVLAVVLAPLTEEIVFRGLVQSGFLRVTGRVWPSVLASSALFAAVHVGSIGESVHALAPLFVLGVCFGIAYERTGRLWVPIVMHAAFNAWNTGLALML